MYQWIPYFCLDVWLESWMVNVALQAACVISLTLVYTTANVLILQAMSPAYAPQVTFDLWLITLDS